MCGIFGVVSERLSETGSDHVRKAVDTLFRLSETRGKESAGLAIYRDQTLRIFKEPLSASQMMRRPEYRSFLDTALQTDDGRHVAGGLAVIGHTRLVTNGFQTLNANNQPVRKHGTVGIHNGIIINEAELWRAHPDLQRECEVDTEVVMALLEKQFRRSNSLKFTATEVFRELEGAASIAAFIEGSQALLLATNTGSIYYLSDDQKGLFCFASERFILEQFQRRGGVIGHVLQKAEIIHLEPGMALALNLFGSGRELFSLENPAGVPAVASAQCASWRVIDHTLRNDPAHAELRRCNRCILPETMPFIQFDEQGVCNYCHNYHPINPKGREILEEKLAGYRRSDGRPDCIVAFSGGRDSSYCLHYLKRKLGMNPIAYTYDWGMVTDIARRNQSRLCSRMGIEHVIVSADISRKRKNIRKNIEAWLRRPRLGMIPLFMAGDKQFFYYANKLRQQTGIDLVIFSMNYLEKTSFKTGFCGVREGYDENRHYALDLMNIFRLSGYYGKELLLNPSYLNSSLLDSIFAFGSYYLIQHDYLHFYKYIDWDETTINQTMFEDYKWETASDAATTWRIGDGTAAFYNYIYFTVAGFTENDTFRSNQIREGKITREEALKRISVENRPRYQSLREYATLIGFDIDEAIGIINSIPKLYRTS